MGIDSPWEWADQALSMLDEMPFIAASFRTAAVRRYHHNLEPHDGTNGRSVKLGDEYDDFMAILMAAGDWLVSDDATLRKLLFPRVHESPKRAMTASEFLEEVDKLS